MKLVRESFAITPLRGKATRPTLMFTTNEHDGVEFFQQAWTQVFKCNNFMIDKALEKPRI